MATTSERTVKRLTRLRAERRRREFLELVEHCWPQLTLRSAHDLRLEGEADPEPANRLNVS